MNKIIPFLFVGIVVFSGIIYTVGLNQTKGITPPIVESQNTRQTTKAKRPMDGQESFGLSVCEEVPKTDIEIIIEKPVEMTEDKSTNTGTSCTYYTNKAKFEHVLIQVSYLSAENQKKGQETLGRTIEINNDIPMENFIAMQENGQINAIYLVMTPNKYVRVDRTANAADNQKLIALANKIAYIIIGK